MIRLNNSCFSLSYRIFSNLKGDYPAKHNSATAVVEYNRLWTLLRRVCLWSRIFGTRSA